MCTFVSTPMEYSHHVAFLDLPEDNGSNTTENETTACSNLDDSYYLKILWTSAAELPGTNMYVSVRDTTTLPQAPFYVIDLLNITLVKCIAFIKFSVVKM